MPAIADCPEDPNANWAHVHVDGIGNLSYTVSFYNGKVEHSVFGNCLRMRQTSHDHWQGRWRSGFKELTDPDSIEWTWRMLVWEIKHCILLADNRMDLEARLKILRDHRHLRPVALSFGQPYYIV